MMNFFGKESQKKTDLQIQTLKEQVLGLQSQLESVQASASKAQQDKDAALHAATSALLAAQHDAEEFKRQAQQTRHDLQAQLALAQQSLNEHQAQLLDQAQQLAAALEAGRQAAATSKALAEAKAKLEVQQKELAAAQAAAVQAKKEGEAAAQTAKDAQALASTLQKECDAAKQQLSNLLSERDTQFKNYQQTEAKYKDAAQEIELLLLQLMQAQEELAEYSYQKQEVDQLYQVYKARWERLEKRVPTYLDFGAIEIMSVDNLSDQPSITWRVRDFAQAGVVLSEFSFLTLIREGQPGIGLLREGQALSFVPMQLGKDKTELANFMALGTSEYRQLVAGVTILAQLEAGQWQGFEFPSQFDPSFWRPSLKALALQVRALPNVLRYDKVVLKRELINTDYEHLWLELHGMNLGAAQWKKFELRLGAALVQPDGFSQYPKFEIPLIDGKTKPFESWYAESHDDSGPKLELRFALDKRVFDVAVFTKLSDADKALALRLVYAVPVALKRLREQKVAIHRPWQSWIAFAEEAVQVLEASRSAAQSVTAKQDALQSPSTPNSAALPSPDKPATLSAPALPITTSAKVGKVISIAAKPNTQPPKTSSSKPRAKTAKKVQTKGTSKK